jgi:insulysin
MPAKQTFDYFKAAVFDQYATYAQKRLAVRKVTEEGFQKFIKKLFTNTFLKGLMTGSLSIEQATHLVQTLESTLHPSQSNLAPPYYAALSTLSTQGPFLLTESTRAQGDAVLLVLETDGFSPRLRNLQQILSLAINEAFFVELRTKQQTGYIVSSDDLELQKHLFNYFVVQSNTHVPYELLWRFEQFFENYLLNLSTLHVTPERFEALKKSLQIKLQEPPSSIQLYGEQQFKLAFDIQDLEWMPKRLNDLAEIKYEDFLKFTQNFLGRINKRRFAIMLEGLTREEAFQYTPLKNLNALRSFKR